MNTLTKTTIIFVALLATACNPTGYTSTSATSASSSQAVTTPAPTTSTGDSSSSSSSTDANRDPASTATPAVDPIDLYKEVSEPMGQAVDAQYSTVAQLMKVRSTNQAFPVDTCDPAVQGHDRFADRIAYAIDKRMVPMKIDIGSSVAPLFNLNKDSSTYLENSLISHPYCNVTQATLQVTFQNVRVPSAATIAKAQQFTTLLNQYRTEALQTRDGQVKIRKLWSKFMMCLGYMESLTSADSAESSRIASTLGFRRPAGVNLHNDSNQTNSDSVLGIGIFQESNVVKWGDSYSCVMDWNRQFPSCPISPDITKLNMVPVLGSAMQTFNAYCGASVISRMFGVQVNSTNSKNTHPANVLSGGKLKAPADRCVSPFMNVATSYNHFGPLQNVSGFTLDNILTCTLKD
jgi:hypothetical protein